MSIIKRRVKGVNKNVVATISHDEYKNFLLNKKRLRHLMNRIQSKNHRIGTYEISKISLPSLMRKCSQDSLFVKL